MKDSNIEALLPKELICEIQKYVQGKSLYIPKIKDTHKKWGDKTKSKTFTSVRNAEIRTNFCNGSKVSELCEQYSLSPASIKKIIYDKA